MIYKNEWLFLDALVIRIMNCLRIEKIYTLNFPEVDNNIYISRRIVGEFHSVKSSNDKLILAYISKADSDEHLSMIHKLAEQNTIICLCDDNVDFGYELGFINSDKKVALCGKIFEYTSLKVPTTFKVLAVIHVYNEEDVIEKTVNYLISEGVDVYLVDNWSDDNSYELIKSLANNNFGKVFYERFPEKTKQNYYDWYHQLERTEELSKQLDYDWFIHYDADEYRISPWKGVTLRETLYFIDLAGFNLVENTVINFRLTETSDKSIFMEDTWFEFGRKKTHFEQIKTWKKSLCIDLKTSGGHIAKINEPRIFPLKILNRHYPLRSIVQSEKKVFLDRKPRFKKERKERGWHSHYDVFVEPKDFVFDKRKLILWNNATLYKLWIPFFTGCGIVMEEVNINECSYVCEFKEMDLIVYGAGNAGRHLVKELMVKYNIKYWVDVDYKNKLPYMGVVVKDPMVLKGSNNLVIVAIVDEKIFNEVKKQLIEIGIKEEKILWIRTLKKKDI